MFFAFDVFLSLQFCFSTSLQNVSKRTFKKSFERCYHAFVWRHELRRSCSRARCFHSRHSMTFSRFATFALANIAKSRHIVTYLLTIAFSSHDVSHDHDKFCLFFLNLYFFFNLQLLKTKAIESSMFDLIICEHVLTKTTLRTRNRSLVVDIRSCVKDRLLKIFDIESCFDDYLLSINMNLRLIWQINWDNNSRRECNVFARSNSRRDNCWCKLKMISIAHFLSN